MLVLLLFFCSGATALVYEVLWSKYLTLMLGSTVQAQTVVLAVFMGGLAIGNRVFGKRSVAIEDPLRTYGILELIIGMYAFLFPRLFKLGDYIFVTAGSAVVEMPILPLALKFFLSVLVLLLPTVLMGGTLPLLAVWIQRQPGLDSGARVGIFYAVNSLGAVFGAFLAGFFLVQHLGLVSSLELTALANLFIGLFAIIIAKRQAFEVKAEPMRATSAISEPVAPAASPVWFGLLVALTGGVSMGLEVLASRALALIVGGSLQAFSLVLMSFILGIGLGSVVISSTRAARKYGLSTIYFLLLSAAILVVIHVLMIERWTILYAQASYGIAPNLVGYAWHQIAVAALAFIVLGLPASFLGAVVPLAIRLLNVEGTALGDQVGRLLTWNTLGAVLGVLLTGFFLMPLIGLRGALASLGIVLIAVTGVIAFQRQHSGVMLLTVILGAGAMAGIASTGEQWQVVVGAGVFRIRNMFLTTEFVNQRKSQVENVFYKDSADATVCVEKSTVSSNTYQLALRINGKSDASTLGDLGTQYLLAHIPMMARPDAKNVFVLGFGSGITGGALLGHPIERLTIAENCKPVLQAAPLFGQWNRGVLTNARTRILNDDARAVLKLRPDKYDVIISEPSNPWVVGIGSVFSQDFYNLCAKRLSDNGVMAQWFHKYEMSDDIVFLIFRTFASVFPQMEIWDTQEGDIVLLGSKKPWPSDPAHYQVLFERPQPKKDLADLRITSAVTLWTRQVASQLTAAAIAGDGPVQTDEFPILEYAAPKAFFTASQANHMYLFDERTLQFTLADRIKVAAMRALPIPALIETFQSFGSSSPDIKMYMQAMASPAGLQRIDPMGHIIFRPADSYPETPLVSTNASPEYLHLLKTESLLLRDDANWKSHAKQIEEMLTKLLTDPKKGPKDFSPPYFAALAVRAAIGHRDYHNALEMLRIGFVFNAADEQLNFLSRVLDRVVPPEILERAKKQDPLRVSPPGAPTSP